MKKIPKSKLMGILQIILGIGFLSIFITSIPLNLPPKEPYLFITLVKNYGPSFIFFICTLLNLFMGIRILINKSKNNAKVELLTILSTLFWLVLTFIGYFLISNVIFCIAMVLCVIGFGMYTLKSRSRLSFVLLSGTVLVILLSFLSGFEENYCWEQGQKADPTGSKMIVVTENEAQLLKSYVQPGAKIGVAFKTHMLCHIHFSFQTAIKETFHF